MIEQLTYFILSPGDPLSYDLTLSGDCQPKRYILEHQGNFYRPECLSSIQAQLDQSLCFATHNVAV